MIERQQLEGLIRPALGVVTPAIALSVIHRGEQLFAGGWGSTYPDSVSGEADDQTVFDLASLSKLFTTTAALVLLASEGLALATPLVHLLPAFGAIAPRPIEGGQNPHTRERLPVNPSLAGETVNPGDVTLWHLFTHTSGLPPWRDVYAFATPDDTLARAVRWERGLARAVTYPFVDRVGANIHYSDIGYILLGAVVERLHGGPLDAAVRALVIDPLGLDATYLPLEAGIARERIAPTEYDEVWRGRRVWGQVHDENAHGLGGVSGHAGLFGTVSDVARFGEAWRRGAIPGLPEATRQQAITEQAHNSDMRRGLGWMLNAPDSATGSRLDEAAFGHTGFTGTSLWIDPARELVIALMTNRVFYGRNHEGIHDFRRAVHDEVAMLTDSI